MSSGKQLRDFLEATWKNPVMGDTFKTDPQRFERVIQQLDAIAMVTGRELTTYIRSGMPELDDLTIEQIVKQEIIPKTLAFCPALTEGSLEDIPRLSALSTAVGLMYWGDQTMDRGDSAMAVACSKLGRHAKRGEGGQNASRQVQTRLASLEHIEQKVMQFARLEDVSFILACFYDQVLHNEVYMQNMSRQYIALGRDPDFLKANAARLAEVSTVSAGFPSISSSLYAIYRQHDPSLVPLSEIYESPVMKEALQICNVTVRLWDELGDWQMDSGYDPAKGLFVINPFNQYHPALIQRFCELGSIRDATQVKNLQAAFASFHDSNEARQAQSAYILKVLRLHVCNYVAALHDVLSKELYKRFSLYIDLCKRVLEIGYVNRVGDITLAATT